MYTWILIVVLLASSDSYVADFDLTLEDCIAQMDFYIELAHVDGVICEREIKG